MMFYADVRRKSPMTLYARINTMCLLSAGFVIISLDDIISLDVKWNAIVNTSFNCTCPPYTIDGGGVFGRTRFKLDNTRFGQTFRLEGVLTIEGVSGGEEGPTAAVAAMNVFGRRSARSPLKYGAFDITARCPTRRRVRSSEARENRRTRTLFGKGRGDPAKGKKGYNIYIYTLPACI